VLSKILASLSAMPSTNLSFFCVLSKSAELDARISATKYQASLEYAIK